MIRTIVIPCSLPKAEAHALNRESARIYSAVLTTHYRIYRRSHQQRWLSPSSAERLNDYLSSDHPPLSRHCHGSVGQIRPAPNLMQRRPAAASGKRRMRGPLDTGKVARTERS
jgi:hypothetical protein